MTTKAHPVQGPAVLAAFPGLLLVLGLLLCLSTAPAVFAAEAGSQTSAAIPDETEAILEPDPDSAESADGAVMDRAMGSFEAAQAESGGASGAGPADAEVATGRSGRSIFGRIKDVFTPGGGSGSGEIVVTTPGIPSGLPSGGGSSSSGTSGSGSSAGGGSAGSGTSGGGSGSSSGGSGAGGSSVIAGGGAGMPGSSGSAGDGGGPGGSSDGDVSGTAGGSTSGSAGSDSNGSGSGSVAGAGGSGTDAAGDVSDQVWEVFKRAQDARQEAGADDPVVAGSGAGAEQAPAAPGGQGQTQGQDQGQGSVAGTAAGNGEGEGEGSEGSGSGSGAGAGDGDGDGGGWYQGSGGRGSVAGLPDGFDPYGDPRGSPDGSRDGHPDGHPDGSKDGVVGGVLGGTGTARSRSEALERELEGALGDFDGRILEERAIILARDTPAGAGLEPPPERGESGGGGAEGADSGTVAGTPAPSRRPAPPPPSARNGSGSAPAVDPDEREGDYEQVASATPVVPPDIPDGTNDDVIARQLREAAMQETDPELRERLWDEYRKYRANQ